MGDLAVVVRCLERTPEQILLWLDFDTHILKCHMRLTTMRVNTLTRNWILFSAVLLWHVPSAVADEPFVSLPSAFEDSQPAGAALPVNHTSCIELGCGAAAASCGAQCGSTTPCNACGCNASACSCPVKPANPCATSHKGLFFNNDFSYLCDPNYEGCCLGDSLNLMPVDSCGRFGTLDVGGQLRLRYHHEKGMAQTPGLTRFQGGSNDLGLTRLRLYTDWKINDHLRFYAEGIYAGLTASNDYVPRGIDENYGDLQNIFLDVRVTDTTVVRVGRQELLYGAQRTVSPLNWANTRRKFEGINVLYDNCNWSVDSFYTNLVPPVSNQFDEADYDQSFYGMYSVYSGLDSATVDLYYLGYDNQTVGTAIATDFSLHTFGARVNGSCGDWLYELEGAPQFGRQSGLSLDHTAGFMTAGVGRNLDWIPCWGTSLWVYYDYAPGNNLGGDFNRYNQLFPLAHKYLGFIDATQRSNIESINMRITTKPTDKLTFLLWYYHLMANQDTDIVPSIGGTPAQSAASKDWGDELDLVATYTINPRSNILFGWSHFWAGNKIVAANKSDADFFYTQWTQNF